MKGKVKRKAPSFSHTHNDPTTHTRNRTWRELCLSWEPDPTMGLVTRVHDSEPWGPWPNCVARLCMCLLVVADALDRTRIAGIPGFGIYLMYSRREAEYIPEYIRYRSMRVMHPPAFLDTVVPVCTPARTNDRGVTCLRRSTWGHGCGGDQGGTAP